MRGRKPTPTPLKLLRGNPGKRPLNPHEPQPDALPTTCPRELTDKDARAEWRRTIVPAIDRRQVTAADRVMAIAHCELWATWRAQLAVAAAHPLIIAVGPHKYPRPNPASLMAIKTLALLKGVDAELGFTPTSRGRVTVAATPPASLDPLYAKFFGR
jgi:P27 family predicted phage terminase small subunit